MRDDQHICATCDEIVDDDHPAEWQCPRAACGGEWFHVGGPIVVPTAGRTRGVERFARAVLYLRGGGPRVILKDHTENYGGKTWIR